MGAGHSSIRHYKSDLDSPLCLTHYKDVSSNPNVGAGGSHGNGRLLHATGVDPRLGAHLEGGYWSMVRGIGWRELTGGAVFPVRP